jgi:hypothetical protein
MGKCWNCGTEVLLKAEEVRCDRCKKIVRYWCNGCANPFDVQDRETKKKVRECKWCGYFLCPSCNICSPNCPKHEHKAKVKQLAIHLVPIDKYTAFDSIAQKIVDYFEEIKMERAKTECAFGVPKTYAKERIKQILARMQGFKTRDDIDKEAFEKKQEEILDTESGHEFTIGNTRDAGTYGQEYRDVFNLSVCLGTLKYEKRKFKTDKGIEVEYDCWIRVEDNPCEFLDTKELVVKICPECKKTFSKDKTYCDECKYKRNSKEKFKGDLKNNILIEKLSDNPTCRNIRNFKRIGEVEESGESESFKKS